MKSIFILGEKNILKNYYNSFTRYGFEVIISGDVSISKNCDILCLAGGGDLLPNFYRKSNVFSFNVDPKKDIAEFRLLNDFIIKNKPIIGICRGLQVINVFFNGTLIQNILGHSQINNKDTTHKVFCLKNSIYYEKFSPKITVNSAHHQAIEVLGDNLVVDMVSNDGIIEAIHHKTLPIIAYQFHPERLQNDDFFFFICSYIKSL